MLQSREVCHSGNFLHVIYLSITAVLHLYLKLLKQNADIICGVL